jgi:hypothetical protein
MPSQSFPRNAIPDARIDPHHAKTIALGHPSAGNKHQQTVVAVNRCIQME